MCDNKCFKLLPTLHGKYMCDNCEKLFSVQCTDAEFEIKNSIDETITKNEHYFLGKDMKFENYDTDNDYIKDFFTQSRKKLKEAEEKTVAYGDETFFCESLVECVEHLIQYLLKTNNVQNNLVKNKKIKKLSEKGTDL